MNNTQYATEENTIIRAKEVRKDRNYLLSECDWTQVSDAPLTAEQKQAWLEYRQALRNITLSEDFPFTIQWPSKPQ